MEREYFEINEDSARMAKGMSSMDPYEEGSATAGYRAMADRAYSLAERVAAERPDGAERAYRLARSFARRMADNVNERSRIGCMCPSVLVSGPANFPTGKKKRQAEAMDRNWREYGEIMETIGRLEAMLGGKDVIRSDDAHALERLEEKLGELRRLQEEMKAANRALRMKDAEKGDAALRELGYGDRQIAELREPDFCGRIGFPPYALQNNNAEIHRVEERIAQLKKAKDAGPSEEERGFCRVVRNSDAMRLQLVFDGKPDAAAREILKSNGFRWAPSQGAWQRMLNQNSEHALRRVMDGLEKLEKTS